VPTITPTEEMMSTRKTDKKAGAEADLRWRLLSHRSTGRSLPQAPTTTSTASGMAVDRMSEIRQRRPTGWPQPPAHPRIIIIRGTP
jgi:hypothetical protein